MDRAEFAQIYEPFRDRVADRSGAVIPASEALGDDVAVQVELILRRRALAEALHDNDVFNRLNLAAGVYQDTALRLYLLLTCVEMIGVMYRETQFVQFQTWLQSKKGPHPRDRSDAAKNVLGRLGRNIAESSELLTAADDLHQAYLSTYGFASNFRVFFRECLPVAIREWITGNCWVYRDNPMVNWAALHLVQEGYSQHGSPQLSSLTKARAKWDQLSDEDRLGRVARICQNIRNDYTHGLIPHAAVQDKQPFREHNDLILSAIRAENVRIIPDAEFLAAREAAKQSNESNGVQYLLDSGELLVRHGSVPSTGLTAWLDGLRSFIEHPVSRGDTVFLWHRSEALATDDVPLTEHLAHWIDVGLCSALARHVG